jgi:hypothetical protein
VTVEMLPSAAQAAGEERSRPPFAASSRRPIDVPRRHTIARVSIGRAPSSSHASSPCWGQGPLSMGRTLPALGSYSHSQSASQSQGCASDQARMFAIASHR